MPITAARSKPSARKSASTSSTASGAHATSRPPEVCGSVRTRAHCAGAGRCELHLVAVAGPVAARRAGDEAVARERGDARMQRHGVERDRRADARRARHLEHVAGQAEAGDVGERVHAGESRASAMPGVLSCVVAVDHRRVAGGVELALLQRGADRCRRRAACRGRARRRRCAPALRFTCRGWTRPIATRP